MITLKLLEASAPKIRNSNLRISNLTCKRSDLKVKPVARCTNFHDAKSNNSHGVCIFQNERNQMGSSHEAHSNHVNEKTNHTSHLRYPQKVGPSFEYSSYVGCSSKRSLFYFTNALGHGDGVYINFTSNSYHTQNSMLNFGIWNNHSSLKCLFTIYPSPRQCSSMNVQQKGLTTRCTRYYSSRNEGPFENFNNNPDKNKKISSNQDEFKEAHSLKKTNKSNESKKHSGAYSTFKITILFGGFVKRIKLAFHRLFESTLNMKVTSQSADNHTFKNHVRNDDTNITHKNANLSNATHAEFTSKGDSNLSSSLSVERITIRDQTSRIDSTKMNKYSNYKNEHIKIIKILIIVFGILFFMWISKSWWILRAIRDAVVFTVKKVIRWTIRLVHWLYNHLKNFVMLTFLNAVAFTSHTSNTQNVTNETKLEVEESLLSELFSDKKVNEEGFKKASVKVIDKTTDKPRNQQTNKYREDKVRQKKSEI